MGKLKKLLNQPFRNDYYLIGEVAYHHAGEEAFFQQILKDLLEIGVDAIKFHIMIAPDEFMTPYQIEYEAIKSWLFPQEQWVKILQDINSKEVDVIVLADELQAMEFVIDNTDKFHVEGLEIHAASLNEYFMLQKLNEFEGVRILGIGGSTLAEISYALGKIKKTEYDNTLLMYGIQNFPTDYKKVKLKNIQKLKELYTLEVGYADHTSYNHQFNAFITTLGYLMGGRVIEKHYSPTPGVARNDYESAVSKKQFQELKELLSISKQVLGEGDFSLNEAELSYGKIGIGKRALVAREILPQGTRLDASMIAYKLTNETSHVPQNFIEMISHFETNQDIQKDEILDFDKIRNLGEL